MNLAYLSMHPAPYESAFLKNIACSDKVKTDILFLFPNDLFHKYWNLPATKYRTSTLSEWSAPWWRLLFTLLRKVVFSRKYDLSVWPGYANKATIAAVVICALTGRKYGIKADSIREGKLSSIAFWVKKFIIQRASVIFVPGVAGQKFFATHYDVPSRRIVLGAYSLDGQDIERQINVFKKERSKIRERLSISDGQIVFLMVANMHKNRCYPITSAGFVKFAEGCPNALFVMVGNGCDYDEMCKMGKRHSCLRVLPGCSFNEMLELYAVADVYVHGGEEPASTALVIGAIAHLPLISTDSVGCSADVLIDNETGVKVGDYLSVPEWHGAFCRIVNKRDEWQQMGDRARALSRHLDADVVAKRFLQTISSIGD